MKVLSEMTVLGSEVGLKFSQEREDKQMMDE